MYDLKIENGISIIIPAYNVEKYIEDCIDSILKQNSPLIEVIIINDGSTDNTLEYLKKYQSVGNVKIISQKNTGVSSARNKGIEIAKKEYILFIDSDDWLEIVLEEIYTFAKKNSLDYLICAHRTVSTLKNEERYIFGDSPLLINDNIGLKEKIQLPILGRIDSRFLSRDLDKLTPIWARLYRTEIIKNNNVKFINMELIPSECMQFNFDFCQHISNAGYIPSILYNYRRNGEVSTTKVYRDSLLNKWEWWVNFFSEKYTTLLSDKEYMMAFVYRTCSSVIPLGGNAIRLKKFSAEFNEVKKILNNITINEALKKEEFSSSNTIWKVFFFFARRKKALLFLCSTKSMRAILNLRKK